MAPKHKEKTQPLSACRKTKKKKRETKERMSV